MAGTLFRRAQFAACILFLLGISFVCYSHPVPDDFDRYIYEAIVRGKSQPVSEVYAIVKHENRRAEESSVLDSPEHLQELEPLYKIRPLYLGLISLVSWKFPIQQSITLISAACYFGIGLVVLFWTKRPLESGLLMAAYPLLVLGRIGTPDALAGLLAIGGLWMIAEEIALVAGLFLLFLSVSARTDNLLILLAVLAWLAWEKRVKLWIAGPIALLALAFTAGINFAAGNYGWIVLFRLSFLGGGSPAQISHSLSTHEYLSVFARNFTVIFSHVAIWILLGILAWRKSRNPLLIVVALTTVAHFILFPSPEDRYLIWAYIVVGVGVIQAFSLSRTYRL